MPNSKWDTNPFTDLVGSLIPPEAGHKQVPNGSFHTTTTDQAEEAMLECGSASESTERREPTESIAKGRGIKQTNTSGNNTRIINTKNNSN